MFTRRYQDLAKDYLRLNGRNQIFLSQEMARVGQLSVNLCFIKKIKYK